MTSFVTIIGLNLLATMVIVFDRRRKVVAAADYRRACRDYRDLVDHRLANPLMVIGGAARTLLASDLPISGNDRRQLLEQIVEQADRMEKISLSPRVTLGPEEHCFKPVLSPRQRVWIA